MTQKKLIVLLYGLLLVLQTTARDLSSNKMYLQGYSGGMMLHTGYLSGGKVNIPSQKPIQMWGAPFGVGGLLRFHFGNHLRIGGEGYNSTLHYGKNNSFMTLSWGGLLIDSPWEINKFTFFPGITIGGGNVNNITGLDKFIDQGQEAIYRKYAVMIADPFIGMEYALNRKMHLITKIDYIINITGKQPDFTKGPRIYFGIVFFHERY